MDAGAFPPSRADARLNRQRILDAADEVFSLCGVQVPLERIMTAAGVGRATFYRHFADRETLLASLLDRAINEMEELIGRHGDEEDSLLKLFAFMLDRMKFRLALVEYWSAIDARHPANSRTVERMSQICSAPLDRAVRAGLCRSDLTLLDISLYGRMLGAAMQGCAADERAEVGARAAALLFNGVGPATFPDTDIQG
ncbi:MAG: TetR/AcrR family transcriptional regulator [Sphingobium sp.]